MYHAGNLADVHKHGLLAWILGYLTRKDKPLSYIETHAGRGLYDLASDAALKTGEAAQGIAKTKGWFNANHPFSQVLSEVAETHGPTAYPGSPMIANLLLRGEDTLHLAELHPQEHAALSDLHLSAHIHKRDGFELALSIAPPTPRRGLCVIDPSYEIKTDYEMIPRVMAQLQRKWPVGLLVLWYPVLRDASHGGMMDALSAQFPDALRHEVTFPPARQNHRMIGSGMFVTNPPYGIDGEATRLSKLFKRLEAA